MFPLALASDAVVADAGEMIGDPTEGALVVLAEKGGVSVIATRERYPRVAELPFDTAYKLMATFHRMTDELGAEVVRCFVKGAPDQLLARASAHLDPELSVAAVDDAFKDRYLAENERLARKGLRVIATARKDFDPATFDAAGDLLTLMNGLTMLSLVEDIVDPAAPRREGGDRPRSQRGHPGADDHGRPRRVARGGDRARTRASKAGRSPARSSPSSTMPRPTARSTRSA